MLQFSDIVGQDEAIGRLQRAMGSGRMPHAFLFSGPAGVGRRTTALALAATLLCEKPVTVRRDGRSIRQACGACTDCRMMEASSHPDLHLVYKELAAYHEEQKVRDRKMQELSIDVIRSFLIDAANRSSSRGRGKVFVVLEAELMSDAAQNALLKTLEEPPAGVTIILICCQGEQMLPTTRSRCSMVRFGPLPKTFVASELGRRGLETGEARFWADFAAGSLGRAIKMSQEGFYKVKRELLERLTGSDEVELAEQLGETMKALSSAAEAEAKAADGPELAKLVASRRAAGAMMELLASAYADALHLAAGSAGEMTHSDQPAVIEQLANRFDAPTLAEIIRQLSDYESLLWRNVNPRIVWDNLAVTCATGKALLL